MRSEKLEVRSEVVVSKQSVMQNAQIANKNPTPHSPKKRRIYVMRKQCLLTCLFLIGFVLPLAAQQRGSDDGGGAREVVDARRVTREGKQWAVFIAIDEYREWSQLFYPVKDAREIRDILREHYYIDEIRELYNGEATAAAIRHLFTELMNETGPNDSVFIFHAGHGTDGRDTITPAWIAYDGVRDPFVKNGWITHTEIRSMLDSFNAGHVFLISDSCYSGALLKTTRGMPLEIIVDYPSAYNNKSRQVVSSGAIEEVADESEFASRLKSILLRTETPYVTPIFLCSQIQEMQTMRRLYTNPDYGPIPESGHQVGGSFLFFRRNPGVAVQPVPLQENTSVTVTPPVVITEQASTVIQPGEPGYFIGSWVATVQYNGSFDTYHITLSANGSCRVKIENDTAQQETTGNWSWDGTYFRLNAVFRNQTISYQRNIQWIYIVSYNGSNSFNINGRAATEDSRSLVRFTFYRE